MEDQPSYARELEYLVLARCLLAWNRVEQALILLEHLSIAARDQACIESIIKIQALQALGLQAMGKDDQAMKEVTENEDESWKSNHAGWQPAMAIIHPVG